MIQREPPDSTVAAPPLPRRAALYTCAAEAAGQVQQEAELRHYAETHGFMVGDVYRDAGSRAARDRLIADAHADLFDVVIIARRGDLARDARDYDHVRDALTEVSVRIIITSEEAQF